MKTSHGERLLDLSWHDTNASPDREADMSFLISRSITNGFVQRLGVLLALAAIGLAGCGDDETQPGEMPGGSGPAASAGRANDGGGSDQGEASGDAGKASTGGAGISGGGAAGSGDGALCGDGVVEANECEPPGTALCSDDCVAVATSSCYDCEQETACYELSESCLAFEGDERALCFDVMECVNDSGCADGESTFTSCFCGELATSACIDAPSSAPRSPEGACAELIRRSMGGDESTNSQVLTRYINVAYPGGAALARMNCDKQPSTCTTVCGF